MNGAVRLWGMPCAVAALAACLSGCATVVNGMKQKVLFLSDPPGSTVKINEVPVGRTPVTINLRRGSKNIVKIEADGYDPYEFKLPRRMSSWFWGNLLLGGPFGLFAGGFSDLLTEGLWKFDPTPVNAILEKKKESQPAPADARVGGRMINIAVAEFTAEGVGPGDAAVVGNILRGVLVKSGDFNVLDRQNMDKILTEHAVQRTGCKNEECAVRLGRLFNVQRIIVGSFGKLLNSYVVSIEMVDVETGKVMYADMITGDNVDQIMNGVKVMGGKLTGISESGILPGTRFP